jgi:hypothetical protein
MQKSHTDTLSNVFIHYESKLPINRWHHKSWLCGAGRLQGCQRLQGATNSSIYEHLYVFQTTRRWVLNHHHYPPNSHLSNAVQRVDLPIAAPRDSTLTAASVSYSERQREAWCGDEAASSSPTTYVWPDWQICAASYPRAKYSSAI